MSAPIVPTPLLLLTAAAATPYFVVGVLVLLMGWRPMLKAAIAVPLIAASVFVIEVCFSMMLYPTDVQMAISVTCMMFAGSCLVAMGVIAYIAFAPPRTPKRVQHIRRREARVFLPVVDGSGFRPLRREPWMAALVH